MKIISREGWNAAIPSKRITQSRMSLRTEFIVHHSAGPANQTVRAIQRHHIMNRGFIDIGYNFLVRGTSGEIYEGRGRNAIGAHTRGRNLEGLGVCVIGTDQLSEAAKQSLRQLYRLAVHFAGHPLQIRGHRDHAATECPGDGIFRWLRSGALDLETLPVLFLTTPRMVGRAVRTVQRIVKVDVDGIYGPITEREVRRYQRDHDLVPDGIVGPRTWAAMGVTELD